MIINPAFLRFPQEAVIVGHLLASFGELEIAVCVNAGKATDLKWRAVSALYRIRSTRNRLDAADALMRPVYIEADLEAGYTDAFARVLHCLRIRNQFAHCNWSDDPSGGLFFADLMDSAKTPDFENYWKHVDIPLLSAHKAYFESALMALRFVDQQLDHKMGKRQVAAWPKPPELDRPPLHNPEGSHIPPWISEDAKARHLARVQAAKIGIPTQTPAQIALEKSREGKRARRQADRERDL